MLHTTDEDPVAGDLRAVIELFATELAKVPFPDVDAASLKRHADAVRAEAAAVATARRALDAAEAGQAAKVAELARAAARAIAYAKIYAESHPERSALVAALAALETKPAPAAGVVALPKRRGRPPRQSAELFSVPAQEPPHSS